MPQSLAKIILHITFGTKNREKLIVDRVRCDLHSYLAGACRGLGAETFRVGGTEDHVHIACALPRTLTCAKLLEGIKKSSSVWMKEHGSVGFSWQAGYGAFSLGLSQLETVVAYIDNQIEHHRTRTFQEEYVAFLEKYRIDYDESYVWD